MITNDIGSRGSAAEPRKRHRGKEAPVTPCLPLLNGADTMSQNRGRGSLEAGIFVGTKVEEQPREPRSLKMKTRHIIIAALFMGALGAWLYGAVHEDATRSPVAQGLPGAISTPLEVTRLGPDRVAVELRGGPSEREPSERTPTEPTGNVRGTVVDGRGQPVAGAVVVGGEHITIWYGVAFEARDGAVTDDQGRFSLLTYEHADARLVAIHHELGMSAVHLGPNGTDAKLQLQPFTWVEGDVTNLHPSVSAHVTADAVDGSLQVSFLTKTDAQGHYRMGPIPPGKYAMNATTAFVEAELVSTYPTAPLVVRPGAPIEHSFIESEVGALEVDFSRPAGAPTSAIKVSLYPGAHATDAPDVGALIRHDVTGSEWDTTRFDRLAPGEYTACLTATLPPERRSLSCQTVEIGGDDEVTVKL